METQIVEHPLSPRVSNALGAWIKLLSDSTKDWAIIRDFDGLPEHCGFDLDVLVSNKELTETALAAVDIGRKHGLVAYLLIKSSRSAKIVWLNPQYETKYRQWLVIDICTNIAIGRHLIDLRILDTTPWETGRLQFHVLKAPWRQTLHNLRRLASHQQPFCLSDLALDQECLRSLIAEDSIQTLSTLLEKKNISEQAPALENWVLANGFGPRIPKTKKRLSIVRKKLSTWAFFNLFFWHQHRPPFIVVTGADGVGKTTLIQRMIAVLGQYPLQVAHYHHLADTKPKPHPPTNLANTLPKDPEVSLLRQILRKVWRYLLPRFVKDSLIGVWGEIRYAKKLNDLLGDSYFSDKLCVFDRYTFDRLVRLEMDKRNVLQRWTGKFNSRFVRPPRLTIFMTDKPENIIGRKAQLSLSGVKHYERRLQELLVTERTPLIKIKVEGKSPEEVQTEVMPFLLDSIGDELPHLISAWEKTFRQKPDKQK